VVYTGTHDNNTVQGWFKNEASADDKKRFFDYIGREISEDEIHWEWVRMAMGSVANVSIVPMQDLLGTGQESRMNHPSRSKGNWGWRVRPVQITDKLRDRLRHLTWLYNRENRSD
jgi:4-alpha-glucanotransferase